MSAAKLKGEKIRAAFVAFFLGLAWPNLASANERSDYLIELLSSSSMFRVRAQAAISLGHLDKSPKIVQALSRALSDEHPAVRIAAAASLESLADPAALASLEKLRKDSDPKVRKEASRAIRAIEAAVRARAEESRTAVREAPGSSPRYYVGVGAPASRVSHIDDKILSRVRQHLSDSVAKLDGVVLAPDNESSKQVKAVLKKRMLIGYYVDSSVVQIERRENGIRAVVSLILGTYPGRDMRAMLQGAASVHGATGPDAQMQALEGAIMSALRQMSSAMQASEARAARMH